MAVKYVCVCVCVTATCPLMKNLFYFAVNLAADKEINRTGDLLFPLVGRLLMTDVQKQ